MKLISLSKSIVYCISWKLFLSLVASFILLLFTYKNSFTFYFRTKPNDPVGNTVGDLVNLLKKPENMAKMEEQKTLPKMTTLDVDDCDIAALVDAIGDQMSKK